MLLEEDYPLTEIKYIDCWCSEFFNNFVTYYDYFEKNNYNIYSKNENIKIYLSKGSRYIYSNKRQYSANYYITYKNIPCMQINTTVSRCSTFYMIIYDYFDKILIYDTILNFKLPELIKYHICCYL
jgi:hypothetical protein